MDQADYEAALQEAKRRGDKRQPPGYKDSGKQDPAAAAGDYLIWTQIQREAKRRERDVLIVTADVKEDWWRREHGELRGPRPELVEEMRLSSGVRLFMMRPETLLLHASQILQVEVQEGSVQDIERVAEAENGGWSEDALGQLLARLSSEGWDAQEQSIRLAALRGGLVEREIVYTLGGYDAERSLRIIKALPDAFRYEYAGTENGTASLGRAGASLVKLKFTPNPDYAPPTRVEEVLSGMQGYLLIDPEVRRLARIDGTLFRNISFGWGIVGHLDRGGHFLVQQAAVSDGSWGISEMSLNITGKILLFVETIVVANVSPKPASGK